MRMNRTLVLCAAAAFISAGCEVHEHDRDHADVTAGANVSVDEPQGEVIDAPGVAAIDVEPDPTQRVYVYDQGYPPGAYVYDNYYYYGGYRYPRDVFVNRYVQDNIRQHRYMDKEQNRRQAQPIEQKHRATFAQNHGVRQKPAGRETEHNAAQPSHVGNERPENNTPTAEERRTDSPRPEAQPQANPERRAPVEAPQNRANEERNPNTEPPQNRVNEERKPNIEPAPQNRVPANDERHPETVHPEQHPANEQPRPNPERENKPNPGNEERKPAGEEPKREEGK